MGDVEAGVPMSMGPLPLAPEDVAAVRAYMPGKVLGRMAALLALLLLALEFAGLVDRELHVWTGDALPLSRWAHLGILFGLPLLAVLAQMANEWLAIRKKAALQALAVQINADQSGYFRIGPYQNDDRASFRRDDRAHLRALAWLQRAQSPLLYLTGDSGSGKSSLLNAFVLPSLHESGWSILQTRVWQDAELALQEVLSGLPARRGRKPTPDSADTRALIEKVVRRTHPLLVVLDQFEEFLVLGADKRKQSFSALVADLQARPVPGLSLLLVLRSDYQTLLEESGLPALRSGENLLQVGRFTLASGTAFLNGAGLNLQLKSLERLLCTAAELDETPGLVRPITLNVIGHVLVTGSATAVAMDAGALVQTYISRTLQQLAIRDHAQKVLEQLISARGTKRPRTETELEIATGLRRAEVRGVMIGLAEAALARPLDREQAVWELSHDFVASAISRHFGRRRRKAMRHFAAFASPALVCVILLVCTITIGFGSVSLNVTRSQLEKLGVYLVGYEDGWLAVTLPTFDADNLSQVGGLLSRVPRLRALDLDNKDISDIGALKGLITLHELRLSWNRNISDIKALDDMIALRKLDLSETSVSDIRPVMGLRELQELDLTATNVSDVRALQGLVDLHSVKLGYTRVSDISALKSLIALVTLELSKSATDSPVADLAPVQDLRDLQDLGEGNPTSESERARFVLYRKQHGLQIPKPFN